MDAAGAQPATPLFAHQMRTAEAEFAQGQPSSASVPFPPGSRSPTASPGLAEDSAPLEPITYQSGVVAPRQSIDQGSDPSTFPVNGARPGFRSRAWSGTSPVDVNTSAPLSQEPGSNNGKSETTGSSSQPRNMESLDSQMDGLEQQHPTSDATSTPGAMSTHAPSEGVHSADRSRAAAAPSVTTAPLANGAERLRKAADEGSAGVESPQIAHPSTSTSGPGTPEDASALPQLANSAPIPSPSEETTPGAAPPAGGNATSAAEPSSFGGEPGLPRNAAAEPDSAGATSGAAPPATQAARSGSTQVDALQQPGKRVPPRVNGFSNAYMRGRGSMTGNQRGNTSQRGAAAGSLPQQNTCSMLGFLAVSVWS